MLAYFDSFSGLVPVRLVTAWSDRFEWRAVSHGRNVVLVEPTVTRGPYPKGQQFTIPLGKCVPRSAIYTKDRKFKIGPYSWPEEFRRG